MIINKSEQGNIGKTEKTTYIDKNNSNKEQKRSREKQDQREKQDHRENTTKRKKPMRNNEKQNDAIMKVGHPHLMIIKRTIHFTGKERKKEYIYIYVYIYITLRTIHIPQERKKKKTHTHPYEYVNTSQRPNECNI